ncbi:hypothetical protein [Nocardiopsis potens]|uniref:hypothetical protein n=1 Tax=Nocardiopsis potens TaxID=1246458 RepID=UPI00034CD772|nr:hypothetical protein [Nocardiopsis potens]
MLMSSYSGSPLHPLYALAKELEARGLGASVDTSVSVVDAFLPGPEAADPVRRYSRPSSFQRAVLRPDPINARPWWWLLWPGERFKTENTEPELTRLLPVEDTADVARRMRNILILDSTE